MRRQLNFYYKMVCITQKSEIHQKTITKPSLKTNPLSPPAPPLTFHPHFSSLTGADPDMVTSMGETSLHYAIRVSNLNIVTMLLEKGANPLIQSGAGTPKVTGWGKGRGEGGGGEGERGRGGEGERGRGGGVMGGVFCWFLLVFFFFSVF